MYTVYISFLIKWNSVLLFVRLNWQRKNLAKSILWVTRKVIGSLLPGCLAGKIVFDRFRLGDQMIDSYHGHGINITIKTSRFGENMFLTSSPQIKGREVSHVAPLQG